MTTKKKDMGGGFLSPTPGRNEESAYHRTLGHWRKKGRECSTIRGVKKIIAVTCKKETHAVATHRMQGEVQEKKILRQLEHAGEKDVEKTRRRILGTRGSEGKKK